MPRMRSLALSVSLLLVALSFGSTAVQARELRAEYLPSGSSFIDEGIGPNPSLAVLADGGISGTLSSMTRSASKPLGAPREISAQTVGVRAVSPQTWHYDPHVSWYGPGFYGRRTACGLALTTTLIGVAHKTLPCGTRVAFRYRGKIVIARVIDRGPYVRGRQWDLTGGLAKALGHVFTGSIWYRILGR
jgi:rare lipoprotein A (peptidoglycan hydrolase)